MKPGMTYDLFSSPLTRKVEESLASRLNTNAGLVKGLVYLKDFISSEEEISLIKIINANTWLADLKRRVQHYGYKYDYRSRRVHPEMYLGPLPNWAQKLALRLVELKLMDELPDQVIVNEYMPGQGIANHIDCEPCFGDTVVSLSLAAVSVMNLVNQKTKENIDLVLEPRSVVVIKGESRYCWTHGIVPRLADEIDGERIRRKLRISVTFRKMLV